MILSHGRRLQVLQDQQVRGRRLKILDMKTFFEESPRRTHYCEEMRPEGDLGFPRAAA